MDTSSSCYACDLSSGRAELIGGCILSTKHWVIEHCTGPLGVGTLIIKPQRHCTHVWQLLSDETQEIGPILQKSAEVVQSLLHSDQVYVCLWSHAGWQPVHIHFVVQPVWNDMKERFEGPGPALQAQMFREKVQPERRAVEKFCEEARLRFKEMLEFLV